MKTFSLVFFLAVILYAANPVLTLKPFSLKFETPWMAGGMFFLVVSLVCLRAHWVYAATEATVKHFHSLMSWEDWNELVKAAAKESEK